MAIGMRSLSFFALAIFGLITGSRALAQNGESVIGYWTGTITERDGGEAVQYDMSVAIDLDRNGEAVGVVSYDLGCVGVWTHATRLGPVWRFRETITGGRPNCAPHGEVELGPVEGGFRVRLMPVGQSNIGDGTLRRQPEPQR